jgi:uncharacterized membrane protein
MMSHWQWLVRQMTRRLWVRASLFSLLGILTALAAIVIHPFIPADLPGKIGAEAVDGILGIIASSMLAVTTFSVTAMVAAYAAATTNLTPRAAQLLVEDTTAQNALATFVGAFLFAVVGIIVLSTGVYGTTGRVVLFAVTILVIGIVVVTLLRWIDHLSRFGRVAETIDRVEQATASAMRAWRERPYLGGRPLRSSNDVPATASPILAAEIGYVQHLDVGALAKTAKKRSGEIYVGLLPGGFADPTRPIAWVTRKDADGLYDEIRSAFIIGDKRSFAQDPRFGLIVLSEISSRALSPAVNDSGTAIDVIGTAVRLLAVSVKRGNGNPEEVLFPDVHVPKISTDDLFDDIFTALARDAAPLLEVGLRLQKGLRTLSQLGGEEYRRLAMQHSAIALRRAEAALPFQDDKERLAATAICCAGS